MPTNVSSSDAGLAVDSGVTPARVSVATVEVAIKASAPTARISGGVVEAVVRTDTTTPQVGASDVGHSTEGQNFGFVVADSGTVTEGQSVVLFLALSDTDAGVGSESAFVTIPLSSSDQGSVASTESIFAAIAAVEIGFMSDSPGIQGTPVAVDAGTLAEATAILVTLVAPATDSGSSTETQTVADFIALSSADSGSVVESSGSIALVTFEIGTSVETESSTAGVLATDSAQQGDVLAVALATGDTTSSSEAGSRIIIFDGTVGLAQGHEIDPNAYLLLAIDATVSLPRSVDIPATGDLVTIVDVQASLSRTVTATPSADALTTAESGVHLTEVRTASVTTDGTDILLPDPPTMQMSFFNSAVAVIAGGQVIVNVSLGEPDDIVSFYWDASTSPIQTAQLDNSGNLVAASILTPVGVSAGTHTLKVVGTLFGLATLDVPIGSDVPPAESETSTTDLPPPPPSSQRWQLFDPYTQETYLLPIGPSQIDAPYLARNLTTAGTTNPLGQQIVWEGGRRASEWTCGGRLVDGDQITTMRSWRNRPHRVWLYDPLGRAWLIKITGVELVPVRDLSHDMTHDWTLRALIYGRKS